MGRRGRSLSLAMSADVYAGLRVFLVCGVGINLLLDADSRKDMVAASLCIEPRSYEPVIQRWNSVNMMAINQRNMEPV